MLSQCPHCRNKLELTVPQQEMVRQALADLPAGKTLKINCPLCKEAIHLEREGSQAPGPEPATPANSTSCIAGLITLVVVIISLVAFGYFLYHVNKIFFSPTPKKPSVLTEEQIQRKALSDAKWECREAVKQRLVAPSTAKFPNYNHFNASGTGDGPFFVDGYVDAQNSFGAMIRTQFNCEFVKSGDSMVLVRLTTIP